MPTPKPTPKPALAPTQPKLLSSCHYCAEEYSWPLDELFWSSVLGDYVCENCWDKGDLGEHGLSALAVHQRATPPADAALVAALQEIGDIPAAKFSRDPLQHAINTIDRMQEIARAALLAATGTPSEGE